MVRKPAYIKIYEDIVNKIENKTYDIGSLLPSEQELEKIYNVSRTPVRATLKMLENDGYIYRVQGKGSYVDQRQPKWTAMTGFYDFYSNDIQNISANTINVDLVNNPDYSSLYDLPMNSDLVHLERVRYYKETPVVFQEHFLPQSIPKEYYLKYKSFLSVQEVLKSKLNINFTNSTDAIEAIIGDERILEILQLPKESPLIKAVRYSYENDKLQDINIFYVNTKMWKYKVDYQL